MSNEPSIEELQNLTEPELLEQVATLDAAQAQALRDLEAAEKGGGRKAVLAAIDKRLAEFAVQGGGADAAGGQAAGGAQKAGGERTPSAGRQGGGRGAQATAAPAAQPDSAPAWQHPDYDGPLTIPQAQWRRENIKPARGTRTK